jgi:hypothetical protein
MTKVGQELPTSVVRKLRHVGSSGPGEKRVGAATPSFKDPYTKKLSCQCIGGYVVEAEHFPIFRSSRKMGEAQAFRRIVYISTGFSGPSNLPSLTPINFPLPGPHPAGLPGGSTGTSHACRFVARGGTSRHARVPPMYYLDDPQYQKKRGHMVRSQLSDRLPGPIRRNINIRVPANLTLVMVFPVCPA